MTAEQKADYQSAVLLDGISTTKSFQKLLTNDMFKESCFKLVECNPKLQNLFDTMRPGDAGWTAGLLEALHDMPPNQLKSIFAWFADVHCELCNEHTESMKNVVLESQEFMTNNMDCLLYLEQVAKK